MGGVDVSGRRKKLCCGELSAKKIEINNSIHVWSTQALDHKALRASFFVGKKIKFRDSV